MIVNASRRRRLAPSVLAAASIAGLTATALPAQAAPSYAPGFGNMSLFVQAHPDDEASSFGAVEDTSTYKVFILLTAGDATGYCSGSAYESPEYRPRAAWTSTPHTQECIDNRRDSFHKFHDDQAAIDGGFENGAGMTFTAVTGTVLESDFTVDLANAPSNYNPKAETKPPGDPRAVKFFVGSKNARVLYNLGDGNLTPEEVRWAVNTVKRNMTLLPAGLTFRDVVGMSFANTVDREAPLVDYKNTVWDNYPGGGSSGARYLDCNTYHHPDHVAVHRALFDYDLAPEQSASQQYASTCQTDDKRVVTDDVTAARWDSMMKKGSAGLGTFQFRYGWLHLGSWPVDYGTSQNEIFHQRASFWRRF